MQIPEWVAPTLNPAFVPPYWTRGQFLSLLVAKHDWQRGAEIGLSNGETSAYLLQHHPRLHMIGVDARRAFPGHAGPDDFTEWDHAALRVQADKALAPYGERFRMIEKLSVDAAEEVADSSLDFVFIDADHSEAACRADILAWLPKIKPGGWITGHDISWPSVRAAVDDMIPRYQIGPDVTWFRPVHPASNWWRWLHHD
jgi:predicted O-methyltransferase YrrM